MNASAIRAVRARFGDLADPIMALREAGRVVAPFGDGFRVGKIVVDAEQLARMAAEITPRKTATVRRPPGEEAGTTGNRATGPGSVLANPIQEPRSSAQDTSDSIPTVEPVVPPRKDGSAGERGTRRTCAKCGRPRSKESKALCAICYAQAGRGSYPVQPTADVRDKFAKSKSCGGGESRPAETTSSLECGGGAAREAMPASEESVPASAGRALDAGGAIPPRSNPALESAAGRNGDTAGVAPGPQEPIAVALCGCSRPKGHHGRCWFKRGQAGPPGKRVYPKGRHHTSRITALETEVSALRADLAAYKATVRAATLELVECLVELGERISGAQEGR